MFRCSEPRCAIKRDLKPELEPEAELRLRRVVVVIEREGDWDALGFGLTLRLTLVLTLLNLGPFLGIVDDDVDVDASEPNRTFEPPEEESFPEVSSSFSSSPYATSRPGYV